jgi:hypothetical protein
VGKKMRQLGKARACVSRLSIYYTVSLLAIRLLVCKPSSSYVASISHPRCAAFGHLRHLLLHHLYSLRLHPFEPHPLTVLGCQVILCADPRPAQVPYGHEEHGCQIPRRYRGRHSWDGRRKLRHLSRRDGSWERKGTGQERGTERYAEKVGMRTRLPLSLSAQLVRKATELSDLVCAEGRDESLSIR